MARVDKSPKADPREVAGPPGGNVAEQVRDDPLREVIRLDLVADGKALQFGHQAPVPANDASDQSIVAEVVQAALLAVALAGGIDQREITWLAGRRFVL